MSTMAFEAVGHVYTVDGVVIPSVTQVLELVGVSDVSGIPSHILAKASAIGTAVHEATEFLDEGDLDLESLDPQIVGYVTAYQKFKEETGFVPDLIEYRTVGEYSGCKYGMCVDRAGKLNGKYTVLDLKTSSKPQAHWALQTMAYACGLRPRAEYADAARAVVHLAKDGTYKLIPHEDGLDELVWESALHIANWRLQHGAKLKVSA